MVGKIWPMKMPARPVVQSEKNALAYFSCRLQAGSTNYLDCILCIIFKLQDLFQFPVGALLWACFELEKGVAIK